MHVIKNKKFAVIAIAALLIFAYVIPTGMDVEAKKGDLKEKNYGDYYGKVKKDCSEFKNKGPNRCR